MKKSYMKMTSKKMESYPKGMTKKMKMKHEKSESKKMKMKELMKGKKS